MISEAIKKLVIKEDLTYDEAYQVMDEIMSGTSTPTQNAAYLAALSTKSTKSETIEEIMGSAEAMRSHALQVEHPDYKVLEIVGTGGDKSHTFNISTTSMFVAAAAGIKVAKHGNTAATSKSGASDVLTTLGANIQQPPEMARRLLDDVGVTFLFAQLYHASMKHVGPLRRELGFRTVFNILGPLTNPAKPEYFVLGVYSEDLVEPLAKVLDRQGVERGIVCFGQDVMDEISISAPTTVCEIRNGYFRVSEITPEQFGLTRATKQDIVGGSPEENAAITRAVLAGEDRGPHRDIILLNAGATLFSGEKAESLAEGVALAGEIIDSGAAVTKLDDFIEASNS
ncbi:MAG: anthranilate phosphoribosyltransferase [Corynebacterium sp.]|nr:anthranilate phosphoribosyltransferase [Corynebacterium sp.]